jgi:hypothetical protein
MSAMLLCRALVQQGLHTCSFSTAGDQYFIVPAACRCPDGFYAAEASMEPVRSLDIADDTQLQCTQAKLLLVILHWHCNKTVVRLNTSKSSLQETVG